MSMTNGQRTYVDEKALGETRKLYNENYSKCELKML